MSENMVVTAAIVVKIKSSRRVMDLKMAGRFRIPPLMVQANRVRDAEILLTMMPAIPYNKKMRSEVFEVL